jgi:hypothetical protein
MENEHLQNTPNPLDATEEKGPVIGLVIILLVIIIGSVYFLYQRQAPIPEGELPTVDEVTTITEVATLTTITEQGTSDEINAIEEDLANTDIDTLDEDLAELDAVFDELESDLENI